MAAREFLQNSALNSNNWFNNQNGVKISPRKQNQFGGTFGGRIRRDKTFFFMDYQGTVSRAGNARSGVASAAERTGDFGGMWALRRLVRFGGKMFRAGGQLGDQ
jgi:hypothetical protein